ncbi:MAG: glycosyltransferase family 4 protein [Deltaproteobacteria bacterium]|nr:glycosyltransferase family 4 protein [Deltaproteobacteria bacterium]
MEAWASRHAGIWTVVAPVPYFPHLPVPTSWDGYAKVPREEKLGTWRVLHPRYFMVPKVGTRLQGTSMAWFSMRNVKKFINDDNCFDLIDAHYVYPDGYAALKVAKGLGVPLVVSARGTDINLYPNLPGIRKKVRKVLRRADAIVGVSQALIDSMIELGAPAKRCHLIPNGVDLRAFHPLDGVNSGRPIRRLLAVGNLKPEKGFFSLLEAMKILKSEHPDLLLSIVGSGSEETRLRAKCGQLGMQQHVSFLGAIPHSKMPEYYRRVDVFCLSSLREGCPNVIMEALATGIPIAATPVGGVPELVRDGANGFLANNHSPQAIADAIARVLERVWDPHEIRQTVKGRSWEKVADEIQKVFEDVVLRK